MSAAELTDDEREALGLFHWDSCTLGACLCGLDRRVAAVESIVAAHVRRALEDAAKDIDLSEFYDPDPRGRVSQECGHAETAAHRWLTARGAAAPDPRETKD